MRLVTAPVTVSVLEDLKRLEAMYRPVADSLTGLIKSWNRWCVTCVGPFAEQWWQATSVADEALPGNHKSGVCWNCCEYDVVGTCRHVYLGYLDLKVIVCDTPWKLSTFGKGKKKPRGGLKLSSGSPKTTKSLETGVDGGASSSSCPRLLSYLTKVGLAHAYQRFADNQLDVEELKHWNALQLAQLLQLPAGALRKLLEDIQVRCATSHDLPWNV